jgi:fructose-1,6-bisphosphatase I
MVQGFERTRLEVAMSGKVVTIERFILEHQPSHAAGELSGLLGDLALAAKIIAHKTKKAGLIDILGKAGQQNVQGEQQQKLDVYADDLIFRLCDHTGRLCVMASEEHEGIISIPPQYPMGKYVLVYDPLDGSSNIDVNVSIGTIFAVFRTVDWHRRGRIEDCLQAGTELVAAGYVIYGSSTMLVYSTGQGVHGFTLDPDIGEFLLSHESMTFPDPPAYYSANHAYVNHWSPGVRKYTEWLASDDSPAMSERYTGSLVADFHRNLLRGGVFIYPPDKKNEEGKLRLLYEASPLGYLAENAGGAASDGTKRILEVAPKDLHQRTPFYVGNKWLVERLEQFVAAAHRS